MANQDYPIFRLVIELCVYIETIVKSFDKYHKYTIGEDMGMLLRIAKELKALKALNSSKLSVGVCKQSQGWLKNTARVIN